MKNSFRLVEVSIAILLASVTAGAAVDPGLLAMAPPDTKVLAGIQIEPALSSPFGQFAWSRLLGNGGTALLQLATATGFDFRRDVSELLLASTTMPGAEGHGADRNGILLARGSFQIDRLMSLAAVIHAKVAQYSNVPVIQLPGQGTRAVAMIDSSTLVVGSEPAVQGVIRRHAQKFLFSGALADKAQAASASGDAWIATVTPLSAFIPAMAGPWSTTFLQTVTESRAGARFDASGLTLAVEGLTHSENEAAGLTGILKLVTATLAGPHAAMFQNARFTSDGATTRIVLTIDEGDLERAFPARAQSRAAR